MLQAEEKIIIELNERLSALERRIQLYTTELAAAERHIASLEEKLIKLKEYRSELKLLKEERRALRKSPERRIGQVLLAPYRLPERLIKALWKKMRPREQTAAATEYQ